MIIGESPGEWEARSGIPFHPRAAVGKELLRYLEQVLRLERGDVYLTNLCPEFLNGRDLTAADIKRWEPTLRRTLEDVRPEVIMTLGREATRWFLGDVNLEDVYALPHRWNDIVIVPNYLRLYDSDLQPLIWYGFDNCRRVLCGELAPHTCPDSPKLNYGEYTGVDPIKFYGMPDPIAVDTEGLPGKAWGLSWSALSGGATVIRAAHIRTARGLAEKHLVLHNSLHDIAILRELGIEGFRFDDTMIMAFLLGLEPQGLKALAYRYRGLRRESYLEVIGPASRKLALEWLEQAARIDWGPAPEEIVFVDGQPKLRQPWSLNKRIEGILGVMEGDISYSTDGNKTRKEASVAKAFLHSLGVTVGKLEWHGAIVTWKECRVPRLAMTRLYPHWGSYTWVLSEPVGADNPLARWEALKVDMPEATDALEARMGTMPEAGLDALEEVFGPAGAKKAVDYSAGDADDTMTIYPILKRRIHEMELDAVYQLDLAVVPMIDRMMQVGFGADREYFQQLGRSLTAEMTRVLDQIEARVGARINPNSSLQVASLLFDKMGLPVQQYTATKQPSTADEVIETLRLVSDDPVLGMISDYRELSKMRGTYADKLWRWLGSDQRIHPLLRITRVPSGRLACSEPNLMAIPVRSQRLLDGVPLGKAVRNGFRAKPGMVLGSWDLDQIEMRVLADRSQDPRLVQVFHAGEDIHQKTASLVFDLPMEQVAKGTWQRDSAKNCGFGIVYGITDRGLQLQLKLRGIDRSAEDCQAMIDAYLVKAYPGVRSLMEDKKAEVRRYGFARTMLGRLRYLPGIHSDNQRLRSEAERIALNHDIQGTAQEIIKLAMVGIWTRVIPAMHAAGYYCEPILQIHDELILEFDPACWDVLDTMVRLEMTEAIRLSVPLGAKGVSAALWGSLK